MPYTVPYRHFHRFFFIMVLPIFPDFGDKGAVMVQLFTAPGYRFIMPLVDVVNRCHEFQLGVLVPA
jgi:hypothetical protein